MNPNRKTAGKVTGVISNLVTVEVDGPVSQNEICYIQLGDARLMAEVIKVTGKKASVQVYESTRGLRGGDKVEFEGHMLEATLGPGLLSSNFDGLQNNLATMEGVFLKRGEYTAPIDVLLSQKRETKYGPLTGLEKSKRDGCLTRLWSRSPSRALIRSSPSYLPDSTRQERPLPSLLTRQERITTCP